MGWNYSMPIWWNVRNAWGMSDMEINRKIPNWWKQRRREMEHPKILTRPCMPGDPIIVQIMPVSNGFVIKVGCVRFVAKTWNEASKGLAEYWKDPRAAEKKYCKNAPRYIGD